MASNQSRRDGFFAQLGQTFAPPPWTLWESGLAFVVLMIGLLIFGTVVATMLSPSALAPTPFALLSGWTVGLGLTAIFVLVRWRSSQEKFSALRIVGETAESTRPLAIVFMLGIGFGLMSNLFAALGSGNIFRTIAPLQGVYTEFAIAPIIVSILFAVIIQPLADGLVFYGVILPRLRASLGGYAGLITTALIYTVVYYLVYGLRPDAVVNPFWYGVIAPFVLGLTFAILRVWTRSTRAVIVANIGAGIIALLVMFTV